MRALFLGLLAASVLLFGCTSPAYVPSNSATASVNANSNVGLAPLALPSLSATLAPANTPTPTPKPTATPKPTPTPKPAGSCTITVSALGYNQQLGRQQYEVHADFTNLPADVQLATMECAAGAGGVTLTIQNNAVERICSYGTSNAQNVTATAGLASCFSIIG